MADKMREELIAHFAIQKAKYGNRTTKAATEEAIRQVDQICQEGRLGIVHQANGL